MDHYAKICHTIDALFGRGVSRHLPRDVEMTFSRTGRVRTVSRDDVLLCTLRTDGGLAITPEFAQMLLKSRRFRDSCVEVTDDAAEFVSEGRSVFCKHVARCGRRVAISSETAVLHRGRVIAVGRAVLSQAMIEDFGRGVAVKVRNGLKGRGGGDGA